MWHEIKANIGGMMNDLLTRRKRRRRRRGLKTWHGSKASNGLMKYCLRSLTPSWWRRSSVPKSDMHRMQTLSQ